MPGSRLAAIAFDDAQRMLSADVPFPTTTEIVPVFKCAGHILAERIGAQHDLPGADSSAMDGYAIRYEDFEPGKILPVQARCSACALPVPLSTGHATRVFTGAAMPAHADTVVMQEYVRESAAGIEIMTAPRAGQHVRMRGEDVRTGQLLLPAGTLLRPAQIALMSAQGIDRVSVFAKLRVGILTTGDEVVLPGNTRTAQQTFDSNGPMLAALVEGMGASVSRITHARDNEPQIQSALAQMLPHCDLIVSAGGTSSGERDLVRATIEALGATMSTWQVRMKPGKPLALATVAGKPFVGLPGNPAAAFAVFTLLITPLIRRMQGRTALFPPTPRFALDLDKNGHAYRDEFLRVVSVTDESGSTRLVPLAQQSPSALGSLAAASGLARIRPGGTVTRGDAVPYYDFQHWLA
ncbi:MAG TPA: gephyrin-like molybdotransferase Glp [Trinickia sp.]|uniref:molybdopterin molybdotransferase MoeA n=1 Tax=Trinickia sp. TaxID=2571163 RepID=UPI002C850EE9|nr:gephyrin-like molybdotransferase Glp [Trinickia sp.]HTI19161.1 gephyrin-like molybdotransferase Glp [Trinickia sp.]